MTQTGEFVAIGALARRTGCSIDTIRFYERSGLLPAVPRSPGGQRRYGDAHARRLAFIRRARALGLGLAEVRDLARRIDRNACDCKTMRALLAPHVAAVARRIAELKQLETDLRALLDACGDAELESCRLAESMLAGEGVAPCCAADEVSREVGSVT